VIDSLLNLVFRCGHRRLTRPLTPGAGVGVPHGETYVVCLDCGKQFSYDPKEMRLGKAIEATPKKAE
jgi:DNA-directed RNA polymerase subunit RPC12/RpoP